MKELLSLLRAMQLYAHSAHLLCKGQSFLSDHELFGDIYSEVEGDFDGVAERIIGLYGEEPLQLQSLMASVNAKIQAAPSVGLENNKPLFEHQLKMEESLCGIVKQIIAAGVTPGVEQLVGEICNKSEMRQYKIKQRLK